MSECHGRSLYFTTFLKSLLPDLRKQRGPWLILLEGDLGTGKTTFVQEFLAQLWPEIEHGVQSPTFLKILSYQIPSQFPVLHMDAYRVEDMDEFLRMGLESYEDFSYFFVEWPEKFLSFLDHYPEYKNALGIKNVLSLSFQIDSSLSHSVSINRESV